MDSWPFQHYNWTRRHWGCRHLTNLIYLSKILGSTMCHWKKISPYKNKWLFVIFIVDHKVTQKFEQQSILQDNRLNLWFVFFLNLAETITHLSWFNSGMISCESIPSCRDCTDFQCTRWKLSDLYESFSCCVENMAGQKTKYGLKLRYEIWSCSHMVWLHVHTVCRVLHAFAYQPSDCRVYFCKCFLFIWAYFSGTKSKTSTL